MIEAGDVQILTKSGYQDFVGIQKRTKLGFFHLITNTERELKCSVNHLLFSNTGTEPDNFVFRPVSEIFPGYKIEIVEDGESKFEEIEYVEYVHEELEVYDIIESTDHTYLTNGFVSHNCDFIGGSNTLISAEKIRTIPQVSPISQKENGVSIYENPRPGFQYMITVDSSRGLGQDYSAFVVINISKVPYKVAAVYRNNKIDPLLFPTIIKNIGIFYNDAFVFVEINDIGLQTANSLQRELEYENLLMVSFRGRGGQELGIGFGSKVKQNGIKMSPLVKRVGCSNLKTIIENDKLIVCDYNIINEFTTFVAGNNSFAAMEGHHDDLVMCLVMFSWCIEQDYFKELTDTNVRKRLEEEKDLELLETIAPVGFFPDEDENVTVEDGDIWHSIIM